MRMRAINWEEGMKVSRCSSSPSLYCFLVLLMFLFFFFFHTSLLKCAMLHQNYYNMCCGRMKTADCWKLIRRFFTFLNLCSCVSLLYLLHTRGLRWTHFDCTYSIMTPGSLYSRDNFTLVGEAPGTQRSDLRFETWLRRLSFNGIIRYIHIHIHIDTYIHKTIKLSP